MSHESTQLALEVCNTREREATSPVRGARAPHSARGPPRRPFRPATGRPAVPAGRDLLELDEHLRGDVQLVDDGVDDVGVVLRSHLHVVAVAVGDGEEDPLPDAEDFPVGSPERLGGARAQGARVNRGPRGPRRPCPRSQPRPPLLPLASGGASYARSSRAVRGDRFLATCAARRPHPGAAAPPGPAATTPPPGSPPFFLRSGPAHQSNPGAPLTFPTTCPCLSFSFGSTHGPISGFRARPTS